MGAHGGMVQAYLRGLVDCIPPRASCSSIHRQSKEVVRGSIYSPSTSQIPVRVTHHHLPLPGGAATMMMHAMSFFPLPILPAYQNRILTGTSGVAGKTTLVYCVVVVPSVMISPCRARSVAVNHERPRSRLTRTDTARRRVLWVWSSVAIVGFEGFGPVYPGSSCPLVGDDPGGSIHPRTWTSHALSHELEGRWWWWWGCCNGRRRPPPDRSHPQRGLVLTGLGLGRAARHLTVTSTMDSVWTLDCWTGEGGCTTPW